MLFGPLVGSRPGATLERWPCRGFREDEHGCHRHSVCVQSPFRVGVWTSKWLHRHLINTRFLARLVLQGCRLHGDPVFHPRHRALISSTPQEHVVHGFSRVSFGCPRKPRNGPGLAPACRRRGVASDWRGPSPPELLGDVPDPRPVPFRPTVATLIRYTEAGDTHPR